MAVKQRNEAGFVDFSAGLLCIRFTSVSGSRHYCLCPTQHKLTLLVRKLPPSSADPLPSASDFRSSDRIDIRQ
ncbi:hypothetical protein F0562_020121 [Nyssa sinensis]|uniref:Uncharacterized protein n=1 Tax=Nyssa sinensis TaxID=561372 RepID=A0A5J5BU98_9ASTE|nr:hypothetical protein F0562_020121 [Nyssa sinensis]